jgi:hypothetical protein
VAEPYSKVTASDGPTNRRCRLGSSFLNFYINHKSLSKLTGIGDSELARKFVLFNGVQEGNTLREGIDFGNNILSEKNFIFKILNQSLDNHSKIPINYKIK